MKKEFQDFYTNKEEAEKERIFLLMFKKYYLDNYNFLIGKHKKQMDEIVSALFYTAETLIEKRLLHPLKLVILTQSNIFDSKDTNSHLCQYYVSLRDSLINKYFNKEPFFTSALEKAVYSVKEGFWKELYDKTGDDILNSFRQIGFYSNN